MFDEVWQRFLAAPTTLGPTPGVREAWHRGRPRYAVWALRVEEAPIRARAAALADHLAPHGVLPFRDPHITVFVAGFPTAVPLADDDVAEHVLAAQVDALRACRLPPPRLAVGGLNAFLSCPVLEVLDPHGDLARLRAPLAALHPEIRFAPYLPHLTVGTFGDTRPTAPVAAAVAPFRGLPPLPLAPRAVDLVSFDADDVGGPLHTLASVPLR
ncbi:MAG: 2'-5' RNA ligase family protein [Myxococcota bacterium]